jgi:hypothetical protein
MDAFRIMQELVAWLHVLVNIAAVIVCLMHVGRSVWARILAAGFALELLVSVVFRIGSYLAATLANRGALNVFYFIASLLQLVASVVIVGGLFGLFSQVAGMLARYRVEPTPSAPAPIVGPLDPA